MKVIVRQLDRRLFLRGNGLWTPSRNEAKDFGTVLEAISFCIRARTKKIYLIGRGQSGEDVALYPFGGDPAVKRELKALRREIRESQRLKAERRTVRARIDMLLAEGKEMKKQLPFKRKVVSEEGEQGTEGGTQSCP